MKNLRKDIERIIHEKYFHFYNSINTLTFILSQSKSFSFSDINSAKNVTYLLRNFLLNSIWLENISEKYRYIISLLTNLSYEISSMHAKFREQIYKLSDEFMKTEVFKSFTEKYQI